MRIRFHGAPVLFLLMAGLGPAAADTLSSYSLYVMNNMTSGPGVFDGTVAAGGNATLNNDLIWKLGVTSLTTLVVGGDLTVDQGDAVGRTVVGGTTSISGGWRATTLAPPGTPLPIDFAAEDARFAALSALIASEPVTPSASSVLVPLVYGIPPESHLLLQLTATAGGINVFDIDAATLASISGVKVNAPSGATVLVNVNDTSPSLSGVPFITAGGISDENVLYNFYNATTLQLSAVEFHGAILAPDADFEGMQGYVGGDVVVKSYTTPASSIEIGYSPFLGDLADLPAPQAAPEPSAALLLAGGIALLRVWARR